MGVVNKRNAMLGWTVWQVGKRVAKKKARNVVPGKAGGSRRPNAGAVASVLAAVGGGLWFWRRRRDNRIDWEEGAE